MLKADLHIHTTYSMDCVMSLQQIIGRCQKAGINCIAIADHGTIEGALKMQSLAPFTVIIAEEILTPYGEIMGMFLRETVPSSLSVEEAISRIRAQEGLLCIPHPYDTIGHSALPNEMLEEIAEQIDVIEVFNARSITSSGSAKARLFAEKYGIPGSAGSDAHTPQEVGNAYVEMPEFSGKDDFLAALAQGRIAGHRTNPVIHVGSLWARLKKQFKNRG